MELHIGKMIGQGNTAEIYKLDDNKILKLFRTGLPKAVVEREFQNGVIVQTILSSVPKIHELIDLNGRHGIIYEEIKGTDMLKKMLFSLWKVNNYARKLAHYHFEIQKPVDDALFSVKEKLEADLDYVDLLSDEYKDIIRKHLHQLPEGNMLCHFDFHPGNIIMADHKAITLDWMTACRGEACADVARTCILLKYGEVAHAPWLIRKIISIFQHHIYNIYIKEYLMISKRCLEDIHRWELPVAAARLREWITDHEKQVLIALINDHCNDLMKKAKS